MPAPFVIPALDVNQLTNLDTFWIHAPEPTGILTVKYFHPVFSNSFLVATLADLRQL